MLQLTENTSNSGTQRPITDGYQILWKTGPHPFSLAASIFPAALTDSLFCEFRPCSDFVTNTNLYTSGLTISVSCTASVPRQLAPLRLIAARTPQYHVSAFDNTERLGWYIDTLECGHQITVYPLALELGEGKKRHRCHECAAAASLPQKKPSQSVKANSKKAGAL